MSTNRVKRYMEQYPTTPVKTYTDSTSGYIPCLVAWSLGVITGAVIGFFLGVIYG